MIGEDLTPEGEGGVAMDEDVAGLARVTTADGGNAVCSRCGATMARRWRTEIKARRARVSEGLCPRCYRETVAGDPAVETVEEE